MTINEITSMRLNALMQERDVSVADLCKILAGRGIDKGPATIYRYKRGEHAIPPDVAHALGRHFSRDAGWFYGGETIRGYNLVIRNAGEVVFRTPMTGDIAVSVEQL